MQRGVVIFMVGVLLGAGAIFAAGLPLMESNPTLGGLVLSIGAAVPMVMAYLAHRASGGGGNPFRGLGWGPTGMYFLVWIGGLLVGLVATGLTLGLGFASFDPEMQAYIDMMIKQAESGGEELPDEARGVMKFTALGIGVGGPLLGAWFFTIAACLSAFPYLGWLYRRLMVLGKVPALFVLMGFFAVLGSMSGLAPNPLAEDLSTPTRALLLALMAASNAPAVVWLFLRTGSVIIAALAQTSYQAMLTGATVFLADIQPALAIPMGVLAIAMPLMVGLALWLWKDPGGEHLAIAGAAGDGTPLTPQQAGAAAAPQFIPPPPGTEALPASDQREPVEV
jgi:hypothetical protein